MEKKKLRMVICVLAVLTALGISGCGKDKTDSSDQVQTNVTENLEVQDVITGDETSQAVSKSQGRYAYGTLDDHAKVVYDEILDTLENHKVDVEISTTDVDEMEHAYQAIRYDYANLFWVDQFSYVTYRIEDEITSIEITPTYTMTLEEQQSIQQQIDAEVDRMLANAPVDGSDYDKALYVYETLISEVDYVAGSENNQNIISVFINHETVCQGYAYATQYLLEKLGITSATVVGQARGQSHAWNLVMLDGDYYYIDTTWGNSQYFTQDDQSEMVKNKYVDYDYFCATTETLLLTHQIDDQIPMPECTATADNYYIHEGRYISTWDPDQIGEMIASAYYSGESQIEIKFATVELYEQAMQYFVEDYHVTDYCGEMDVIRYIEKGENSILFLQF